MTVHPLHFHLQVTLLRVDRTEMNSLYTFIYRWRRHMLISKLDVVKLSSHLPLHSPLLHVHAPLTLSCEYALLNSPYDFIYSGRCHVPRMSRQMLFGISPADSRRQKSYQRARSQLHQQ